MIYLKLHILLYTMIKMTFGAIPSSAVLGGRGKEVEICQAKGGEGERVLCMCDLS